jgi:thiol-disulfide isomerase/thioredoxin
MLPIGLSAVVVLAVLTLTGCSSNTVSSNHFTFHTATALGQTYPQAQRKLAEPVTGTLLNGAKYQLADDLGKVVVVNFWATWCPPCVVETPQLQIVYQAYQAKGVAIVGVDTDDAPEDNAQAFVADNKITFPIVYDEKSQIALQLGDLPIQGLPFTVLVDKQGKVAAVYQEPVTPKDLEPVLNSLLAA